MRVEINPKPQYELSSYLFMQFMEPLGTTDPSVEAGWDFVHNCWRSELIETIKKLSPTLIRWGGIFSSYWNWREGIGPRSARIPMVNLHWGGIESNQVGLHEFIDLCQEVGADPLICVNFESDGRPEYMHRASTAEDAADLVRYCNDPHHPERRANGVFAPWKIKLWQVGNETSYPKVDRRFSSQENAEKFLKFAQAMKNVDPSIELIGWGDKEEMDGKWWAKDLLDIAGEYVDYVAIHMMMQKPQRSDTILTGMKYMQDRDRAWAELLEIYAAVESKLVELEEVLKSMGSNAKIAITEGHLSLQPHNTNFILHEWLAGLYSAKVMNLYERHGNMVKIATLADFFGNRWTVNAIMVGGPYQQPYLMPVGVVMSLYRHHIGKQGIKAPARVGELDLAASRTNGSIFLHVVNSDLSRSQKVEIVFPGLKVIEGKAFQIAPEDIATYVDYERPDALLIEEIEINGGESISWTFPPKSVTAMEIKVKEVKNKKKLKK